MSDKNNFWIKAAPLLLVIFIDGMGLGLVIPVLNALIFDPNSHFLQGPISATFNNFIYGLNVSLFMFCWFFGAAILGDLSDKIGRKKSLIICLLGAFLSYLVSALSVTLGSITLLLIGRVIGGLTSGSQPIAQAAIIDLSSEENKARNIGFILLALSLGFIFGPLFGGILSDKRILSWFNYSTPFYFAATISFINALLLWFSFTETSVLAKAKISIKFTQAIDIFVSAFKHDKIKKLSILFFIFIFGWSSFYSFISLFLLKIYGFTPTQVSLFMAVMGLGFAVGTGILVHYFTKRFTLKNIFVYSLVVGSIFILLMIALHKALICWILMAPLACCISLAYSTVLTIFSDQVDASNQGWVMGITGSILALVWAVNGILVGIVAAFSATLPLVISVSCLIIAIICAVYMTFDKARSITQDDEEIKQILL